MNEESEIIEGFDKEEDETLDLELVAKPSLCLSCKKDNDPNEEEMCMLTRMDCDEGDEFLCGAYEKIAK
jgi:hypothetical protein